MPLPSSALADRLRRALFSRAARRVWALLLLVLTAFVLYMALSPHPRVPTLGWDKANHVAAFAALAFTGLFALRARPRPVFWVSFGLLALGGAIELAQARVPGRASDGLDLLADACGIVLGLMPALALARRMDRRKKPRTPQG
jgi:VanZ family protein